MMNVETISSGCMAMFSSRKKEEVRKMPEMQTAVRPETQTGNLSVIGAWLIRNGFSYDDRRRILSLFSSHASVSKEAVKEILGGISDAKAAFGRFLSRLLP